MTASSSMLPALTFVAGAALASAGWALSSETAAPTSPTADCPRATACDDVSSNAGAGPPAPKRRAHGPRPVTSRIAQPTPAPTADCNACECVCPRSGWPEDLPEQYSEAEFRAAFTASLSAAAPDVGFEIDCAEFPCLASITDRRLDAEERKTLREQLLDRRYPDAKNSWTRRYAVGPGGHSQIEVITVFPEELDDDDLQQSLQRRVAGLVDRPRAAVAADE